MLRNFLSFPTIDLSDNQEIKYAVLVESVTFGYCSKTVVLKNFSIKIAQGGIFALLGSNGCGKTTLLKLILGRVKPKTGWIRVFGLEPGHKQSNIPGPGVGYMPQEIALFSELTIKECLRYFGNIYKMVETLIEHRIELLVNLLSLPNLNKRIDELSGGQQRLVSMAAAIIHRPKLLILDEPTVGIDSILRYRIWSYLENITKFYGTTVLITTHYIEEAKNANNVGFISNGILLKQSNPKELLQEFNCETLENVFLTLCEHHYQRIREARKSHKQIIEEVKNIPEPDNQILVDTGLCGCQTIVDFRRIAALIKKAYIRQKRSLFTLSIFLILPLINLLIFKQTVGTFPRHIPIAIYTGEDPDTKHMAQRLLDEFIPDQLRYEFYSTKEAAIDSVIRGKDMYAFAYPVNYSWSLTQRMPSPFDVSAQVLNNSVIRIYADHSNSIAAIFVRYTYLVESVIRFLRKFGAELGLNPFTFQLPIDSSKPIFPGSFLKSETYPSPGILVIAVYLLSITMSALVIIRDLKNKSLERLYVSGVKPIEIFMVHMIEMFFLNLIQSLLVTLLMYYLFEIPIDNSFFQTYLLVYLHGIEGAGTGFLIALVFKDEVHVFIIIVGLVIPLMTCSGVIWPLEAIPLTIRFIVDWTPISKPLDSLRSILFRGLTIKEPRVLIGFIVCIVYNLLIYLSNIVLVTYLKDFDFPNFFRLHFRG